MKTTLLIAACLALGLVSTAARADIAPPNGIKRVGYSLTVNVTGDTANQVVFAYPCSGSDGAPGRKVTPIGASAGLPVGSHESCQIYVVAKSAYDAWAKDAGQTFDTPADGLLSQAKVCDGKIPNPSHQLPSSDPRSGLSDTVDIKVASSSCTLTVRPQAEPAKTPTAPAPGEKKSGCNASGSSSLPLLLTLPALALLLRKRRA